MRCKVYFAKNRKAGICFSRPFQCGKVLLHQYLITKEILCQNFLNTGKDQTINFYSVNDSFYLVDLPGYGYAATGPVEQEKWDRMIRRYLEQGEDIEEVVLLLDCRRIPSEKDLQMFQWILFRNRL